MIYNRENPNKIWNEEKEQYHYYFDTMTDLPNLPGLDEVAPGSDAYCVATQDVYILNGNGVWEVQ